MDKTGYELSEQAGDGAPDRSGAALSDVDRDEVKARVIDALRTVFDPEIPVNIYELGLVYGIEVSASGEVDIAMTLTSPACPVAGWLPVEVQMRARDVEGVSEAFVELVWEPPWTPDMMTEAARLELGLM